MLNGETWEMGDIKSHISLERLMEIHNQINQGSNGGIVIYGAQSEAPGVKSE